MGHRLPWLRCLDQRDSSGLTFSYRLDTTGASLTEAEVPFATGTTAPQLTNGLPISAGIQNPAHIAQFAESAEQAASPAGYAKFQSREATVRRKTGADLNSLIKLLTGNLIVSSDTRRTMARADVTDPALAASTLSKLVSAPKLVFSKATSVSKFGGGFYGINEPGSTITLGVVGSSSLSARPPPPSYAPLPRLRRVPRRERRAVSPSASACFS